MPEIEMEDVHLFGAWWARRSSGERYEVFRPAPERGMGQRAVVTFRAGRVAVMDCHRDEMGLWAHVWGSRDAAEWAARTAEAM